MTRKEIKDRVMDILTEALFLYGSKITEYDNVFDDFNADNSEVLFVEGAICKEFGIEFTDEDLIGFRKLTVRQIIDLITEKLDERDSQR